MHLFYQKSFCFETFEKVSLYGFGILKINMFYYYYFVSELIICYIWF